MLRQTWFLLSTSLCTKLSTQNAVGGKLKGCPTFQQPRTISKNQYFLSSIFKTPPTPPPPWHSAFTGCFRDEVSSLKLTTRGKPGSQAQALPGAAVVPLSISRNRNFGKIYVSGGYETPRPRKTSVRITDIENTLFSNELASTQNFAITIPHSQDNLPCSDYEQTFIRSSKLTLQHCIGRPTVLMFSKLNC